MPIEQTIIDGIKDVAIRSAKEAGDIVSTVISRDVTMTFGEILETNAAEVTALFPDSALSVKFNLSPREDDVSLILFGASLGAQVASLMMMEPETTELSDSHADAVKEMGDQILGALSTIVSEQFGRQVQFGSVRVEALDLKSAFPPIENPVSLQYAVKIGDGEEQKLLQLVSLASLERFTSGEETSDEKSGAPEEETEGKEAEMADLGIEEDLFKNVEEEQGTEGATDMAAEIEEEAPSAPMGMGDLLNMGGGEEDETMSEPPAFRGASAAAVEEESSLPKGKIEILMDLSLPVSIELGRTKMLIKDILELGHGSVIEFDKLAGEPVDLLIYDKKVAEGEVVVIDEHFGIRLTNIIKPSERIKNLGGA